MAQEIYAVQLAERVSAHFQLTSGEAEDIQKNFGAVVLSIRRRMRWTRDRDSQIASALALAMLDPDGPIRRNWNRTKGRLLRYAEVIVERELREQEAPVVCPVARPSRDTARSIAFKEAARACPAELVDELVDDSSDPLDEVLAAEQRQCESRIHAILRRHVPMLLARAIGAKPGEAAPGMSATERADAVRQGFQLSSHSLKAAGAPVDAAMIEEYAAWVKGWRNPRSSQDESANL